MVYVTNEVIDQLFLTTLQIVCPITGNTFILIKKPPKNGGALCMRLESYYVATVIEYIHFYWFI